MHVEGLQKLTSRQKEILRLLLKGFDTKSIASELDISVHTVTEHLREARRHLGVSNSREAARILGKAEATPPKNMGPKIIGVGEPAAPSSSVEQSSTNRSLVYIGAIIMILLATAVLSIALSYGETPSQADVPVSETDSDSMAESDPNHFPVLAIPVDEFDQMKVSGAFKVSVFVNDRNSQVSLVGPRTMTADVAVSVDDGVLTIRFREGAERSWNPGAGVNVSVSTPDLASIALDGPGDVEINGPKGDSFVATTEAAGSINVTRLDVGKVELATNGSGSISANGSAREANYSVGGSGSIDAMRLRVAKANIEIGSSGSGYANVSDEARISLSARSSGGVEVVGGGTCISQPANSDRVECR